MARHATSTPSAAAPGLAILTACMLAMPAMAATPADCSTAAFPAGPAHGQLGGKPFTPKTVTLQKTGALSSNGAQFDTWTLKFQQPEGDVSFGREAELQFLLPAGKAPAGRTFRRVPGGTDQQPAVTQGIPQVQGWDLSDFNADIDLDSNTSGNAAGSLRVVFGKAAGATLPGRIYLCAPKDKHSWLGGRFTAATTQ